MITIRYLLNSIAFILTIFLVLYGLNKGFDLVELSVHVIYFAVIIITLLLNLFEKK